MATTKHTPGPWSHGLDDDPPDSGIWAGAGCVAHVQEHGNVNTIARTGETFSHADARLIAAAPDLLAACKEAMKMVCGYDPKDDSPTGAVLRAAIAKAEGGS